MMLFAALLVAGLFPFIVLSFYTLPGLEDYAESIIPEVWWHVKYLYLTYDGRYFVSFLFAAANPLKYDSYLGYQLIPIVLIILLFAATFALFRSYVTNLGTGSVFALSVVVMLTFIDLNPNIPYSFYYMISSYIYMLPCIMFMLLLVVCKKLLTSSSAYGSLGYTLVAVLLIVAISGSNELLLPPVLVVTALLAFLNHRYRLGKGGEVGVIALSFLCALFVVFTSPGVHDFIGDERGDVSSLRYNWEAVTKSVRFSGHHMMNWLTGSPVLYIATLVHVLVLLTDRRTLGSSRFGALGYRPIFAFAALGLVGTVLVAVPYCWASGDKATHTYSQVFVVTEMFFLMLWFATVHVLTIKLHSRLRMTESKTGAALALATVLMAVSLLVNPSGNVHSAYRDLLSGEAAGYLAEVSDHIHRSRNSAEFADSTGMLQLCELKHRPRTIFSGIYFKREDEGFHLQYRRYYNIERLEISECE